jgi:pimeloyl-[acyl-carrier protein] methyl ester esterase
VQDVLSHLPPRCVLLAWSLGGQVALEIARFAPQRVLGLALIATTPRFARSDDWEHGLESTALPNFHLALKRDWRQTLADFIWLQLRGSNRAGETQQWIREALQTHGLPAQEALEAGLMALASNDLRRHLPGIQHPTLLLAGQNDRITPSGALRWMNGQMPRSQFVEIRGAGHVPFLSHVEECAEPLREFLLDVTDIEFSKSSWRMSDSWR